MTPPDPRLRLASAEPSPFDLYMRAQAAAPTVWDKIKGALGYAAIALVRTVVLLLAIACVTSGNRTEVLYAIVVLYIYHLAFAVDRRRA